MKGFGAFAKRLAALVVAVAVVLAATPAPAFADASRVVTIGADLTAEQRANVLKFFGLTEQDLSKLTVVNVTNADERAHLAGSIDLGVIGNKTYSCSYIQPTNSGGIYVKTANLNYVTNYMLYNALQTAGVKNCNLVVTAPFEVSGTGALTGVFMAYEAQGQALDTKKEEVATKELVATAELTETYGNNVAEVVSEAKDEVVSKPGDLSDDQIREIVRTTSSSKGITLSDADLDRLVQIISSLQSLDYDTSAFTTTLADFKSKLNEVTEQAGQAGGILEAIGNFFKGIIDWFANLFNGGKVPSAEEAKEGAENFFKNFNTDVFQWDDGTQSQQGQEQATQQTTQQTTQQSTQEQAQTQQESGQDQQAQSEQQQDRQAQSEQQQDQQAQSEQQQNQQVQSEQQQNQQEQQQTQQ